MTVDEGKDGFPSPFGRYTLTERLATGGMAEVFKAKITAAHGFEKPLVIKRILPNLAADRNFVSMFIDEAKLTAQLVHPKIVQVIDFGEVKGQYFIALEFIDGFDALALLRGSATKQIRVPMPICMFIAMEVLDALDYAHNAKDGEGKPMKLVHRDISPSNVFLARRGDVKLGDFGIAHAQERESKTQAGTLKGKYGYMSPEQVVGAALDGRSDVFAVGIVLAEMLMGRRLFTAANDLDVLLMVRDGRLERLDKYARDLPPALDQIVRKALAKKVQDRYQSAAEFRDALADLLFQAGMRVSPSDIGRIAVDFVDPNPEATVRLTQQCKRWELRPQVSVATALPEEPASVPSRAPLTPHGSPSSVGSSPGSAPSASAFRRASVPDGGRTPTPAPASRGGAPASHGRAPARGTGSHGGADDPLEIELDEPAAASRPGTNSARIAIDPAEAAKLDQLLLRPLAVVDLDKYDEPDPAVAPAPSTRTPPPVTVHPTATADLGVMTPLRIFCDLAVGRETGLLRIETPPHTRDVYVIAGAPAAVASTLAAERFAETMVASGILSPEVLQAAHRHKGRFGGRLADALIGLQVFPAAELARLVAEHARRRIIEMFALSEGRVSFFRGLRNPEETPPLELDPFELLGAGVLTLPLEAIRKRFLPLVDQRPVATAPMRFDPQLFRLGPTPQELWAMLDGSRSVREWLAGFSTPDEQLTFLKTLYLLTESGLARLG